jgi:ParB family protein of integrating conjugative element (PFGI_1 class)
MRTRQASIEERRRLVAESLQVGNPGNRARDLPEQADPRHDCHIEVRVEDIRPYERNPRRANNAKFAEIKESIRATGIRNPLTVTRRPGEKHFIIEAGGNTRLLAVQQLWAETRDPRFEKLTVLFRPWRSDAHVLVAHLIENEQRGELTFWDKANGIVALKAQFEEEKGRTLSLRQLEDELRAAGFSVSTASLAHYLYATARLAVLGEAIPAMSHVDVRDIQPRLNLVKRYAQMRGAMDEATLYAVVFEPVFRRHADRYRETGTFNASELCQACEEESARHLGEDLARFRMILDALAQSPQLASLDSPPAMGSTLDASAVKPFNGMPESTDRQETLHAARKPGNSARTVPPVLRRLNASIARFAQLAVREGLEERARSLLALVSRQFDESVRSQLSEAPGMNDGNPLAPMMLDGWFLDWLLDGRDEAAAAFWEIAALVRELRSGNR